MKMRISELAAALFLLFCIFQNLIFNCIPRLAELNNWDEGACLILLALSVIKFVSGPIRIRLSSEWTKIVLCILGIIITGLTANLLYHYEASFIVILYDIVGFLKFPVVYMSLQYLGFGQNLAFAAKRYVLPVVRLMAVLMAVFGASTLFLASDMVQIEIRHGIHPFQFLFTHPTYMVTSCACILALLNSEDEATGRNTNFFYEVCTLLTILLAMRTKGFALIAVYIFLKYSGGWMKRFKVLYWIAIVAVTVLVSYEKLSLYVSFSSSPRESLYLGALYLMRQCFPFGSGFATYASHLSMSYPSKVYDFIYLSGISHANPIDIGDAGFAYYMGQFGLAGTLLTVLMIVYIFRSFFRQREDTNLSSVILLAYVLITLTSEAILVNNGVDIGVVFAATTAMHFYGSRLSEHKKAHIKLKIRRMLLSK